jgi:hypothetical protein
VYKSILISKETFGRFISAFFQSFGILALFLGVFDIFLPNAFSLGYEGIVIVSLISLIWSVASIWPRQEIRHCLSLPDTCVTIKVGDLFEEDANLVIGMNDVFDTEKGDIIKVNSIQGQFLQHIYHDDRLRLDQEIESALQLKGISGQEDVQKTQGKNIRYPIGTVVTLESGTKKYFCSAYSHMGADLKAQSDIKMLSLSLEMLWEEIRLRGQRERVAMGVLGSDLARISNASHSNLIKLIILSFILASRVQPITQELVILVYPANTKKVNMLEINDFLQGL